MHSLKLSKADSEAGSTFVLVACGSSFFLPHGALNEAPSMVVDDPNPGPADIDTFSLDGW